MWLLCLKSKTLDAEDITKVTCIEGVQKAIDISNGVGKGYILGRE
jgi:hypothetical protein